MNILKILVLFAVLATSACAGPSTVSVEHSFPQGESLSWSHDQKPPAEPKKIGVKEAAESVDIAILQLLTREVHMIALDSTSGDSLDFLRLHQIRVFRMEIESGLSSEKKPAHMEVLASRYQGTDPGSDD